MFFVAMPFFSGITLSTTLLKCVSMNNQECKGRPEVVNVNNDEPVFYPFSIKKSKNSGSCNNINDSYAKMCVPAVIKNINVQVFNIMSRTNETTHIKWHETCKCKCRLDASVCNNKQRWNNDKCRCECEELNDKGVCHKGFIWYPNNCECKCDKSCDLGEYLDYENSRKRLVDKLVQECTENIAEITLFVYKNLSESSWTLYIVLFFDNLYNHHWNWYLFCLLETHKL